MSGENERPNPELLLEAIRRQESGPKKGKLKIFLGMAPGVGKTYSMLKQAYDLKKKGVDVVVGIVETHKRQETEQAIQGLEVLPRKQVAYRGIQLEEMDLEQLLQRRPQLVLIDEAAHTNAPGCRHRKRYQDIMDVVDAGINVFTTLNIQHLESRSEIVKEITGITVQETLPDSFLDHADEIVLIDLDPEELLKRLHDGKIYSPDKAAEAARHFFQVGHLTALRELALRATSEQVDLELQDIRRIQNADKPWKATERLLVAVFASPYSEKLIRRTRILASAQGASWFGAYVETSRAMSDAERNLLSRNLALVRQLGGHVLTTLDDKAADGILRLARENNISQIIVGRSRTSWLQKLRARSSLIETLLRESKDIDIYVVTSESQKKAMPWMPQRDLQFARFRDLSITTLVLTLVASFGGIFQDGLGYRGVGILFLIAVAFLALTVNRFAIWVAAILSGIIWSFIFVPPALSIQVASAEDMLLMVMFIVTAAIMGQTMAKLRRNQMMLAIREHRTGALYSYSKHLSAARSLDQILELSIRDIASMLDSHVVLLLRGVSVTETLTTHPSSSFMMDDKEKGVAVWVAEHNRPAGLSTDTLPSARAYYVPLSTQNGNLGVLGIEPEDSKSLTPETMIMVESIVQQLVGAIERELLHEIARAQSPRTT
jgi:two-component system sensor histidine kinase KdpD